MTWIRLALRRLRDDPVPSLAAAALVLVSAFVAASVPGLLGRASDDALRGWVAAATPRDANLELRQAGRIPADQATPLRFVDEAGARLLGQLPASIGAIVDQRIAVVETPRWAVTSTEGAGTVLALRIQEDVASHLRVVAGRAPGAAAETVAIPAESGRPATTAVGFEAWLAAPTAARMRVGVGDLILLGPDLTDPLARGRDLRAAIRIVGTYEVTDPAASVWLDDRTIASPGIRSPNPDLVLIDATALMAPEAYPALLAATDQQVVGGTTQSALPLRYMWRLLVDPARLHADAAPGLLADLRRAETIFPGGAGTAASQSGSTGAAPFSNADNPTVVPTSLTTGLPRVLAAQLDAWRSALAILTLAAAGPTGVALATLGLLAVLAATRRRQAVAIWYRRGARRAQVLVAVLAEALAVGLPAAAAGIAVALAVAAGDAPWQAVALGASVLAVAVGLTAATTLWPGAGPAADGGPDDPAAARTRRPRRLVIEGLVVVLAVAATLLVRGRGLTSAGGAAAGGGVLAADPLVAATPILLVLAAAVVAIHLAPLGLRLLASAAARRRDLVPALAFRRSTRSGRGVVILAVLLTASAIAAFSLAGMDHLARSSTDAAWQAVGADARVSAPGGGPLADAASSPHPLPSLPGAVAAAGYREAVPAGTVGDQADLLALDPAYADVVAGTPADPGLPPGLLDAAPAAGGTLPGVVSSSLAIGRQPVVVGDTVVLSVRAQRVPVAVVAVLVAFPSLPAADPFVIVSLPGIRGMLSHPPAPTLLYVRAPDATAATVRDAVAAAYPESTVIARSEVEASLAGAPLVRAVETGLGLGAVGAALYAALAVVAALALAGAAGAAEMAHLRALGVSRRQHLGLVLLEQVPTVGVAYAAGLAAGFACFLAVLPGLGLASLVGASAEIAPAVDPARMLALLGALTAAAGAAILVGTYLEQRAALGPATRRGIE